MPRRLFTVIVLVVGLATQIAYTQQNRIKYNKQSLFLNGANLAWVNYASDIGPGNTDFATFADIMLSMHDHGGNALRWWLHTNGTSSPQANDSGYYVGPGIGTISDMKRVLDLAWEREIGVILCLWSFNMLENTLNASVLNRNMLLLTDTNYTRRYINTCLVPMVDSLKGHPAIIAWEIFNEPEGMSLPPSQGEFGWSTTQHVPMSTIQRFVNLCTGAIHRRDSSALVTNGSWSFKALTDVPSTLAKAGDREMPLTQSEKLEIAARFKKKYDLPLTLGEITSHLEQVAGIANYNYYSDSRLIAAGGDPKGVLDFYSVHYYTGIDPNNPTSISPFHHPSAYWGLNKPIVVAEFWTVNTLGVPRESLYDTLFQTGYAGALGWSWTDNAVTKVADLLNGMQSVWDLHRDAVDVNGISGMWPTVSITAPVDGTNFADSADVTITADAADSDGSIASVAFFVADTTLLGRVTSSPYTVVWKKVAAGQYGLTAVATDNQGHMRTSSKVNIRVGTPKLTRLEAEAASRSGSGMSVKSDAAASGGAYVDIASQTGTLTWTVPYVPADGNYDVVFGYRLKYDSPKTQYLNINGVRQGSVEFTAASSSAWYEKTVTVSLLKGSNTIQMELFWGWMFLDYLAVPTKFVVVSAENPTGLPTAFGLSQNYPNPFNPKTTIIFHVPAHKDGTRHTVTLHVLDILGRKVATLVNEVKDPGSYSVTFDASMLGSGVYFYQLASRGVVDTKKMMVVK